MSWGARADAGQSGGCTALAPLAAWQFGADLLLALVCLLTALYLLAPVRVRVDAARRPAVCWGGALALACGLMPVLNIAARWVPLHAWQSALQFITTLLLLGTAWALRSWIPLAKGVATMAQLQQAEASLQAEVQRRSTAEAQLVETQQNLAVTLASLDAGLITADRHGQVTRMNAAAERVTGWSQELARHQPLQDVFCCDEWPPAGSRAHPVESLMQRGLTVERVRHCEVRAVDGKRLPVEMRAALTRGEDGLVAGIAVIFRDVTSQRQAEVASSLLAAIVESSNDAIVGKTLEGRITSWNRAAQAMFGYTAEEAIGQSVQMLIPSERANEEERILQYLSHGEKVPAFDTVRLDKAGRKLDVSITVSPILDRSGRIIGASKIARDVTRQRRAEMALRSSQARLRFTLESAAIGDWDLDLASGQIHRSVRHDRCFGYASLQPEWTLETLLAHVHADDRQEVHQGLQRALWDGRPWHVQCRVIWPDGSVHWIRIDGKVQLEDGQATHLLGIVTEITQQKQAESVRLRSQQLEAENRQIQEASRLKSQFLANMSHELRTPLNAVIGFADLLQSGFVPAESPKFQQFLGHIGTSGRHLLQLINDVLDLSKVESGKFEFVPESLDLPSIVAEVIDVLHTDIQRKHIVVYTDIDPVVSSLFLDSARLKQVLYNYLSNAIKFTADGGVVSVLAMAEGDEHVRIEVHDSGIGISAEDLSRLFVEFQQLDAGYSKKHQGTGLGLALTRRLVEAQGGSVGVRSVPGEGSVFHVVLNRVHGSDAQHAAAVAVDAKVAASHDPEAATARLLVVQPEHQQRMRLLQAAQAAGLQADAASTGAQALIQARQQAYSAIALDLRLPDVPGLKVLDGIRSQGASCESPVVGVSMSGDEGDAATFAITDVLSKPIRSEELLKAMARFRGDAAQRIRVMVVDDDPRALDLMQATLASIGIDAVCLPDGRQALQQVAAERPDAMILDLMMPGLNGFDVLDALRQMPAGQDLPVFIWTSMILSDEEYASLSASARMILSKGGGSIAAWLEGLSRSHLLGVQETS